MKLVFSDFLNWIDLLHSAVVVARYRLLMQLFSKRKKKLTVQTGTRQSVANEPNFHSKVYVLIRQNFNKRINSK